jgi:hypothetical protein
MSIISLFSILGLICFFIFISNKKVTTRIRLFLSNKKVNYILAAYSIILICSVVLMYVLPTNHFTVAKKYSADFFGKYSDAITGGNLDKIKSMHKQKEWSYNANFKKLTFNKTSYWSNQNILVKWKSQNDGRIKIISYAFIYSLLRNNYYVDYTNKAKSPTLYLKGSTLHLAAPSTYNVKLSYFTNELSINQFMKEDQRGIGFGGSNVLVLYVPKNMHIDARNISITYAKTISASNKGEKTLPKIEVKPNTKKITSEQAISLVQSLFTKTKLSEFSCRIDKPTGYYLVSWANPGIGTGTGWYVNPYTRYVYTLYPFERIYPKKLPKQAKLELEGWRQIVANPPAFKIYSFVTLLIKVALFS